MLSTTTPAPSVSADGIHLAEHWLKAIRADELVLARTSMAGDWGVEIAREPAAVFHFVVAGGAYLRRDGQPTLALQEGELIVFPRGAAHRISQQAHGGTLPLRQFLAMRAGAARPADGATTLMCGRIGLGRRSVLPALAALPEMVHVKASAAPPSPLAATLRMLHDEIEQAQSGSPLLVQHLLASLFIFVLRDGGAAPLPGHHQWMASPAGARIARAVRCIQEAPALPWTIAGLAEQAGLSRSSFIKQFGSLVGESPHSYLVRWRIDMAAQLLEHTGMRLAEIAERVGYQSEFSFSRAFKKTRQLSPMQLRASLRDARPRAL